MYEQHYVISYFVEEDVWKSNTGYPAFLGETEYYEDYFEFETEQDNINFFDGELPTLRFEKMTKDDFLEEYGEIENVSELLE